jgi:hypothetical protein
MEPSTVASRPGAGQAYIWDPGTALKDMYKMAQSAELQKARIKAAKEAKDEQIRMAQDKAVLPTSKYYWYQTNADKVDEAILPMVFTERDPLKRSQYINEIKRNQAQLKGNDENTARFHKEFMNNPFVDKLTVENNIRRHIIDLGKANPGQIPDSRMVQESTINDASSYNMGNVGSELYKRVQLGTAMTGSKYGGYSTIKKDQLLNEKGELMLDAAQGLIESNSETKKIFDLKVEDRANNLVAHLTAIATPAEIEAQKLKLMPQIKEDLVKEAFPPGTFKYAKTLRAGATYREKKPGKVTKDDTQIGGASQNIVNESKGFQQYTTPVTLAKAPVFGISIPNEEVVQIVNGVRTQMPLQPGSQTIDVTNNNFGITSLPLIQGTITDASGKQIQEAGELFSKETLKDNAPKFIEIEGKTYSFKSPKELLNIQGAINYEPHYKLQVGQAQATAGAKEQKVASALDFETKTGKPIRELGYGFVKASSAANITSAILNGNNAPSQERLSEIFESSKEQARNSLQSQFGTAAAKPAAKPAAKAAAGTVRMETPDGRIFDIAADQVDAFIKKGGKRAK